METEEEASSHFQDHTCMSLCHATFKMRTLMPGELPESYMAHLCWLAKVICYDSDIGTMEQFVVCQFVDWLPEPTQS